MEGRSARVPWVIIVVALFLVIELLVLGNLSYRATERATFTELNQRQLMLAREAVGGIELYFEALAAGLRVLGRVPEAQSLGEELTKREIQHTFGNLLSLGVNDVGVLDASATLRYNAAAPQFV